MTTIKQIADKVGCSETTVRRVLRGGNKEVWSGTSARASRIREAARQAGFLPNASAAAVKTGKFNAVLLILSTERGRCYLPEPLLYGLCSSLDKAGLRLVIGRFSDEELTDRRALPSFLRSWSCDGALINYTDRFPSKLNELVRDFRIPSIWLNAPFELDCVKYDDRTAAREAVARLASAGCKRISYVDLRHDFSQELHYSAYERILGYEDGRKICNMPPVSPVKLGNLPADAQVKILADLFKSPMRPDGIIAFDRADRIVIAAAGAGLREAEIPKLAVFCHEFSDIPSDNVIRITAPCKLAAETAVSALMKKISHGHPPARIPPLRMTFVMPNAADGQTYLAKS